MTESLLRASVFGVTWLLAQAAPPLVLPRTVIAGRVAGTEAFARRLSSDLWFCLNPYSDKTSSTSGWQIHIGPSCDRSAPNFTVVTPPLHGPNATGIDASHFDVDPGANLPGPEREFRFVVRREDFDAIVAMLDGRVDAKTVLSEFDRLGRGRGVLNVTGFARHENAMGQSVFDWLEFRAELWQR
jgi:hypothetical protein